MSKIVYFIKRLMLAVVAMIIAMIVAEFACRLIFPEWAPVNGDRMFWVHDSELGWFHEPGEQGRFRHPDFDTHVRINTDGFRDQEYATERDSDHFRVVVLGDSFVWGYGVEEAEIFCERIEARRSALEMINAGVSGYGTDQEYLLLKSRGLKYHPDAVLLLFHPNDLINNSKALEYWHSKPVFRLIDGELTLRNTPVPQPSFVHRVGKAILTRTWLYARLYRVLVKPVLDMAPAESQSQTTSPTNRKTGDENADSANPTAVTKSNRFTITEALLVAIRDTARNHGAAFALVSVPASREIEEWLTEFCRQQSIPYLPLGSVFAKATEPTTFPHDIHWNAYGHKVAADAVETFMSELDWLRSEK